MFLIVFFTGNEHENPWKITKFALLTSENGRLLWEVNSSNIPYTNLNEALDRFNNCVFIENNQVLLSTLYNYFVIDKKLQFKQRIQVNEI